MSKSLVLSPAERKRLIQIPKVPGRRTDERIKNAVRLMNELRIQAAGKGMFMIGGLLLHNFYGDAITTYREQNKRNSPGPFALSQIETASKIKGKDGPKALFTTSYMSRCIRLFWQVTQEIPDYGSLGQRTAA